MWPVRVVAWLYLTLANLYWPVFLGIALFSRQPSEVSTGSPFCPGRRSESRLQKASRTLLRIRHQDLLWRCVGNGWTTWRERPMTTLFLSLKTSNQSSSPTLRILPLSAWELRAVHSGGGTRSSNSGQTNNFLKWSEACDCRVQTFVPQSTEKYVENRGKKISRQELRIQRRQG